MASKTSSSEVRLESDNQVVNQLNEILERFNERLTLDNIRLGDRYIKGEVHLLIHIRLAGKEYVADLQRLTELREAEFTEVCKANSARLPSAGNRKGCLRHTNNGCEQNMVLVGNVQSMEHPESHTLPTLVRFGCVNCIYSRLRHALYASMTLGFVFRGKLPDGKTDLTRFFDGKDESALGATNLNQLPREMVKGASEVVDNVASNKSEISGRVLDVGDIAFCVSRLRVFLESESIGFGFESEEPLACGCQVSEVLFGPFNLYPNERESFIGS